MCTFQNCVSLFELNKELVLLPYTDMKYNLCNELLHTYKQNRPCMRIIKQVLTMIELFLSVWKAKVWRNCKFRHNKSQINSTKLLKVRNERKKFQKLHWYQKKCAFDNYKFMLNKCLNKFLVTEYLSKIYQTQKLNLESQFFYWHNNTSNTWFRKRNIEDTGYFYRFWLNFSSFLKILKTHFYTVY